MRSFFPGRTTGEILVLSITFTVCFSILFSGMMVGILSLWRPEVDITMWVTRITSVINTLIGVIAGFLAGRGSGVPRDEEDPPEPKHSSGPSS